MTSQPGTDMSEGGDSEALERSQQAIDEGNEAAREALDDEAFPGGDLDAPGTGEGLEADEEDVAPRPN